MKLMRQRSAGRYGEVGEVNQVKQQEHNRAAWLGKH